MSHLMSYLRCKNYILSDDGKNLYIELLLKVYRKTDLNFEVNKC